MSCPEGQAPLTDTILPLAIAAPYRLPGREDISTRRIVRVVGRVGGDMQFVTIPGKVDEGIVAHREASHVKVPARAGRGTGGYRKGRNLYGPGSGESIVLNRDVSHRRIPWLILLDGDAVGTAGALQKIGVLRHADTIFLDIQVGREISIGMHENRGDRARIDQGVAGDLDRLAFEVNIVTDGLRTGFDEPEGINSHSRVVPGDRTGAALRIREIGIFGGLETEELAMGGDIGIIDGDARFGVRHHDAGQSAVPISLRHGLGKEARIDQVIVEVSRGGGADDEKNGEGFLFPGAHMDESDSLENAMVRGGEGEGDAPAFAFGPPGGLVGIEIDRGVEELESGDSPLFRQPHRSEAARGRTIGDLDDG